MNALWSMVKLLVQNGSMLIDSAFVLRALTFEFGRYGLVHKAIPFWNIELHIPNVRNKARKHSFS
jgi:hypothetical protein